MRVLIVSPVYDSRPRGFSIRLVRWVVRMRVEYVGALAFTRFVVYALFRMAVSERRPHSLRQKLGLRPPCTPSVHQPGNAPVVSPPHVGQGEGDFVLL